MSVRPFGSVDGRDVHEIGLAADGIEARILTWGGVLRDLVVDGRRVLLGLETIEDYVRYSPSFGAAIGRYANRIAGASFPLEGRRVEIGQNEGRNTLHGGPTGFGTRIWSLLGHDATRCHLGIVSEDGEGGWPGRLVATLTYELRPATLRFAFASFADAVTPVNLTVHGYYNLDGSADVRDHFLQVEADGLLPVDAESIPTGEIRRVAGTPYDFTRSRPIRPATPVDYDHNWVLRRAGVPAGELARAATLTSPAGDLSMELWTSEPGLQVYDGYKLAVPVPGHDGRLYGRNAGLALEPQRFPDGPNQSGFPNCLVRPGEVCPQISELRFRRGE